MSWRAEYRAGLVDVASALERIADEMKRTNDMNEAIRPQVKADAQAASAPIMVTTPAPQFVDPKPEPELPDDTAEVLTDDNGGD